MLEERIIIIEDSNPVCVGGFVWPNDYPVLFYGRAVDLLSC